MPRLGAGERSFEAAAIVFDKDGVLLDFHHLWAAVTHARVTAVGGGEALRDLLGLDAAGRVQPAGLLAVGTRQESMTAAATFLHQQGVPWHAARARAKLGFETADAGIDRQALTRALPGVPEALHALRAAGFQLAIATTDETAGALHFLDACGLRALFGSVVGADRVAESKPAPFMFRLACAELGVRPGAAVMVGDVDLDLMMGRTAGCAGTIGVRSGVADDALLAPHADVIVDGVWRLAARTD